MTTEGMDRWLGVSNVESYVKIGCFHFQANVTNGSPDNPVNRWKGNQSSITRVLLSTVGLGIITWISIVHCVLVTMLLESLMSYLSHLHSSRGKLEVELFNLPHG